jgi:hypothetical protein
MKNPRHRGHVFRSVAIRTSAGARIVCYHYCVSIVVMTFRRSSDAYYIPAGESAVSGSLTRPRPPVPRFFLNGFTLSLKPAALRATIGSKTRSQTLHPPNTSAAN